METRFREGFKPFALTNTWGKTKCHSLPKFTKKGHSLPRVACLVATLSRAKGRNISLDEHSCLLILLVIGQNEDNNK